MDELSHRLGSTELKLSAATVIGPAHGPAGLPNQDAYDLISGDGFLVLAVADGAGSLARSDEGSELAVEVGAGMAADLYLASRREGAEPDLPKILAQSILEARSTIFTLDFWREAGSTLVLALLTEDSFAVATVGDSFAVVETAAGDLRLVQPPAAGEFANITKLLTSEGIITSICGGELAGLSGLALCSDAFEHATLEQRIPTAGFWDTVFSMARSGKLKAKELISFMDSQGKIDDDATLIALAADGADPSAADSLWERDYSFEELRELAGESPDPSETAEPQHTAANWRSEWDELDGGPRGIPTVF